MTRKLACFGLTLLFTGLTVTAVPAEAAEDRPEGPPPDRPAFDRPQRDREPGGFGRRSPRPPRIPLLTALDSNHDGEISAEEMENATVALKSLDENEDGKLTPEELRPQFDSRDRSGREGERGPRPPEARRRNRLVPDGPPDHGPRDAEGRRPQGGDREHAESPRRLPPEERDRGPRFGRGPGMRGPIGFVMRLDTDDDDQLSQAEFLELFSTADRDDDGFVTRGEIEEMAEEHFETRRDAFRRPHGRRGPRESDPGRPERPRQPE